MLIILLLLAKGCIAVVCFASSYRRSVDFTNILYLVYALPSKKLKGNLNRLWKPVCCYLQRLWPSCCGEMIILFMYVCTCCNFYTLKKAKESKGWTFVGKHGKLSVVLRNLRPLKKIILLRTWNWECACFQKKQNEMESIIKNYMLNQCPIQSNPLKMFSG